MSFLFDVALGRYAPVVSGVLGLAGSAVLALPALSTADSRRTLLQLQRLQITVASPQRLRNLAKPLLDQALREINSEQKWLRLGMALIGLAFLQLALHGLAAS